MPDGRMRRILGSCHCGNLRFVFDWPEGEAPIPVRACGCSFCRKHGAAWTSHPAGRLGIEIADEARRSVYRFGTGTADFHVCRACGAVPITTCEIDGRVYGVVNVNCFDDIDPGSLVRAAASFEGESLDDRLARRAGRWTPVVAGSGRTI
ncbi:MAG: hypothetical protein U1E45_02290 [Geminicoccaceae bacterium]